jgi:MipA family protein
MKKLAALLLIFFMAGFFFHPAWAQDRKAALVPLPSVDDFTRGHDGWGFGIGMGIEYESAYEGSDEFGFEVQPAGGVQWRKGNDVFFWAGEALGWRGLRADTWLLEAAVGFDEGRKEGDSDDGRLNGLGDAEESAELVLQARFALDAEWRHWLVGRVVTGRNGSLALFGVGRRFGDRTDGSGSELNIVAVFHNSKFANQGFGINAQQALASGLPQTELSGGLRSIGLDYVYRLNINRNWQIVGEALYERFSGEVRASPIARSSYEAEVGIGFVYRF